MIISLHCAWAVCINTVLMNKHELPSTCSSSGDASDRATEKSCPSRTRTQNTKTERKLIALNEWHWQGWNKSGKYRCCCWREMDVKRVQDMTRNGRYSIWFRFFFLCGWNSRITFEAHVPLPPPFVHEFGCHALSCITYEHEHIITKASQEIPCTHLSAAKVERLMRKRERKNENDEITNGTPPVHRRTRFICTNKHHAHTERAAKVRSQYSAMFPPCNNHSHVTYLSQN